MLSFCVTTFISLQCLSLSTWGQRQPLTACYGKYICVCPVWCALTHNFARVTLTPHQQAATQIRLTGPGVSNVETDARASALVSVAFSLISTDLPNLYIKKENHFPATYPTCPRWHLFSPLIWFLILLLQGLLIRRAWLGLELVLYHIEAN